MPDILGYTHPMTFVDTHCHLNFAPLRENLPAVLARARACRVARIVVPAYDLASWDAVETLAGNHEGVYAALGLHPWASDDPLDCDDLASRLKACDAVAVGEIGLDFKLDGVNRDRQLSVLADQLEVARRLDLPVLLHCRGAFEELFGLLDKYKGVRGVVHAFSRGPELLARILAFDMYVAFGGTVTRPGAKRARRSARSAPLSHLLTETDAPSIGLHGVTPEQVEPRHVVDIVQTLSQLRGATVKEISEQVWDNANRLFQFEKSP
jgi:TatD DNase family protein